MWKVDTGASIGEIGLCGIDSPASEPSVKSSTEMDGMLLLSSPLPDFAGVKRRTEPDRVRPIGTGSSDVLSPSDALFVIVVDSSVFSVLTCDDEDPSASIDPPLGLYRSFFNAAAKSSARTWMFGGPSFRTSHPWGGLGGGEMKNNFFDSGAWRC